MSVKTVPNTAIARANKAWGAGMAAGLAGGAVEVAWIALYQQIAAADAAAVARGVTQTVLPGIASAPTAVALGLAIHMGLAAALGIAIALALPRLLPRVVGTAWEPIAVVAGLIAIWAVNFFIVLPHLNPAFVTLVPLGASLVSKVLFGLAAALVLRVARRHHAPVLRASHP